MWARILTTSPKFTLDGEGIAIRAPKERGGKVRPEKF